MLLEMNRQMRDVIEADDFNPKKIADDLFERCKKAKQWFVYCYIDEAWTGSDKPFPFEMEIVDGVVGCRVITSTYTRHKRLWQIFCL